MVSVVYMARAWTSLIVFNELHPLSALTVITLFALHQTTTLKV